MKCPICSGSLEVTGRLKNEGNIEFSIDQSGGKENLLLSALHKYWRWKCEGTFPGYDGYHEYINWDPETRTYKFDIQIYDSSEGDTWWGGEFQVAGGGALKIISQGVYSR